MRGGAELTYQTAGCGATSPGGKPVLVLLYGVGFTSTDWAPELAGFSTDFCVIAPEFRGIGLSDYGGVGPYTNATDVADVVAMMNAMSVTTAVVVGHSRGGLIAQGVAINYPNMVDKLVLVDTAPSFVNYPGWTLGTDSATLISFEQYLGIDRTGWTELFLGLALNSTHCGLPASLIDYYRTNINNITTARLSADIDSLITTILTDQLAAITMPTFVMYGTQDGTDPQIAAVADYFRLTLSNVYITSFYGSGHTPQAVYTTRFQSELGMFASGQSAMCDFASGGAGRAELKFWLLALLSFLVFFSRP